MWALTLVMVVVTSIVLAQGCEREGLFPGPTPKSFVVCSMIDGVLIRSELFCNGERVFSLIDKSCVNPGQLIHPYLLSEEDTNDDVDIVCTKPGISCKSCNQIQICIGQPGSINNTKVIQIIKCDSEELCQVGKGCVSKIDENAFCSYRKFECKDVGIYPDPYNCNKYYFCLPTALNGIETIPRTCGSESSYNATTKSCGYPMNSADCYNRVVPLCSKEFQLGAVTRNIFYICIKVGYTLAPDLYSCPGELFFNSTTLSCE